MDSNSKQCIACDEFIRMKAKLCRFCGTDQGDLKYSNARELTLDQTPVVQKPATSELVTITNFYEPPVQVDNLTCPECGFGVQSASYACEYCGFDLRTWKWHIAELEEDLRKSYNWCIGSAFLFFFAGVTFLGASVSGGRFFIFLGPYAFYKAARSISRIIEIREFQKANDMVFPPLKKRKWFAISAWVILSLYLVVISNEFFA